MGRTHEGSASWQAPGIRYCLSRPGAARLNTAGSEAPGIADRAAAFTGPSAGGAGVLAIYAVWRVIHLAWTCDDAFISYRYAKHLVEGQGLVFNPGSGSRASPIRCSRSCWRG